jgi:hypothetical protein
MRALFSWPDDTGKTFPAEIPAACLVRELHRFDLDAVVSKYVAETKKSAHQVSERGHGPTSSSHWMRPPVSSASAHTCLTPATDTLIPKPITWCSGSRTTRAP